MIRKPSSHLNPTRVSQGGSMVKNPPANAGDGGDAGLIPASGRFPGVGNGNPLQYSCLENSMDRGFGGLQSLGVAKSKTRRSTHTQRTHLQSAQNNSSTATMIYRALYARYTSKVVSSITSQYSLLFPGNWGLERSSHLHRSS